jgi:3-dehydro-L-gulonate 2-dehydrogenase
MIRITYAEGHERLRRILERIGFTEGGADLCARLFMDASRDGVSSHGLNRFPAFLQSVRDGIVDPKAEPVLRAGHGVLERWDGNRGPGPLNAYRSMERAVGIARRSGVGCVALANTNHWMRGGNYGRLAAERGVVAICWTNTMPNLPAWGAREPGIGNNPLVVAVPRPPDHVVIDMAMSQFSYGVLDAYRRRGERLPAPGGFDSDGHLTDDPGDVLDSARPLPIGFWKGSGLALVLDLVASLLSAGLPTHRIPPDPRRETGLSQVFIAIDPSGLPVETSADELVGAVLAAYRRGGDSIRYPGERVASLRRVHAERGIPVDPAIWAEIDAEGG